MAEGQIGAYWNLFNMAAREVAPVTHIYGPGDDLFELARSMGNIPPDCPRMMLEGFESQEAEVRKIEGLFRLDTENIGATRRWLQAIAANEESESISLDGAMLVGEDGKLWQLMEHYSRCDKNFKPEKPWGNPNNFYPNFALPEESQLVISKRELEKFEAQFLEPELETKPLLSTERNTLLIIIAALCESSGIKHQERGVAAEIARMTERLGASITDDTIRLVLKKIPDALGSRAK